MTEAPDPAVGEAADAGVAAEPQPELLHGMPITRDLGQLVLHVPRDDVRRSLSAHRRKATRARALPPTVTPERFEVVISLLNHTERTRARLRVQVPESDPRSPSIVAIHPGAEGPERETADLMGISFDDHPDPTRILMPDDWVGHPLRKDYDVGRIPVQFKAAPGAR